MMGAGRTPPPGGRFQIGDIRMAKIPVYFREARQELGKVLWPSKRVLTDHTVLVIAVSIALAAFIGLVDYLSTIGFERFLTLR